MGGQQSEALSSSLCASGARMASLQKHPASVGSVGGRDREITAALAALGLGHVFIATYAFSALLTGEARGTNRRSQLLRPDGRAGQNMRAG